MNYMVVAAHQAGCCTHAALRVVRAVIYTPMPFQRASVQQHPSQLSCPHNAVFVVHRSNVLARSSLLQAADHCPFKA